jgi:hypothetical protein
MAADRRSVAERIKSLFMLLAFLDGVQMAALDAGVFKRFENCACCWLQFHGGILEKDS